MSCYFSQLSAVTEVKSTNPWFQGSHHYLVWGQWTYAKPWFQGSHHYLVWGQWTYAKPWFQGSHQYLVWGQWIFAVSSLPERAEMSRGCLFPDSIPNRDVKHRLLIKLTGEGSYKIGGFHCLLPKDRITWDNQYIVHIYYIHIWTVVKEVNKGIRCANLQGVVTVISIFQSARLITYLVPAREPKREVLPQPLTLLRLHICDQEPRDYLITITTSVAVWDLLVSSTGNSPALHPARIVKKAWFK